MCMGGNSVKKTILKSIRGKLAIAFGCIFLLLIVCITYSTSHYDVIIKKYITLADNNEAFTNVYDNIATIQLITNRYEVENNENKLQVYKRSISSLFSESKEETENIIETLTTKKEKMDMTKMLNFIETYESVVKKSLVAYDEKDYDQGVLLSSKTTRLYELFTLQSIVYHSIIDDDLMLKNKLLVEYKQGLIRVGNAIIIALSLICIFIIYIYITRINKPIKELICAADQVSKGDFDINLKTYCDTEEIFILNKAFMTMSRQIDYYVRRMSEKGALEKKLLEEEMANMAMQNTVKELKLKTAYAQINPHFLFNTLNIISQMAMMEEADHTLELMDATTSLLRYNLDCMSEVVMLQEEVENLRRYVFIQKKRFGSRIDFNINMAEELSTIMIPSLILQPLVENAIIHGLKDTTTGGEIGVSIYTDNNQLCIDVNDNGIGFSPQLLENFLEENTIEQKSKGIGLCGVKTRLELYYNRKDIISLCNNPGGQVLLRFPFN